MRCSVYFLVYYIIHNTYNTTDRRGTAVLTSEIYNVILHNMKEMNTFGGHLIKENIANYMCIDTYKVPANSGTGDNVDTFLSNILKTFKLYFKLTLMSPGKFWSYLFLVEKAFQCKLVF